ncbi:MAG: TonB-dependent receptor [Rhodobacteraceae bacterium]|nr:TonB-dependent receptor [Paracoccaceae bacterium]
MLALPAAIPLQAAIAQTSDQSAVERKIATGVTEISDGSSTRTIYDRDFFAAYSPLHARDMVELIPGVAGIGAAGQNRDKEDRRGLRSNTDQVLINGKRVTSKQGDSSSFLEKIPITRVLRIEVIVGNVKEIDADVGSRVINIVTDGSSAGSGGYNVGIVHKSSGETEPVASFNYGADIGAMSYSVSIETRPNVQPSTVTERFFDPLALGTGGINEIRDRQGRSYVGRGLLTYAANSGATYQVNTIVEHYPTNFKDTARTFAGLPASAVFTAARLDHTKNKQKTYEISGDVVYPFGSGHKFLGLAVFSNQTINESSDLSDVLGTATQLLGGDSRSEKSQERILRGTLQLSVGESDQFEIGVEGARNTLDKNLDFYSIVNGQRVDTTLFNSDQVVSEDRVEVFASYSWRPFPEMEIEPGLAAEFSWLDQVGTDVNEQRSFKFAKPSLNVYYTASPSAQIYFNIVRDVGQLQFADFAVTVNREDDEILGGNPFLVPEKSWDFTLGFDFKLPDGKGNLGLKGFYRRISDVLDRVPLARGTSGPGNLGSGTHYGGKADVSLKLAKFNLIDATVSSSFTLQDSSVHDAFSGIKRRIAKQPRYEWSSQVRHDIRAWKLSYGFEYNKDGPTIESDVDKFDHRTSYGDMRLFAEYTLREGLILRTFITNALSSNNTRDRIRYQISQADGRILQTERRVENPVRFLGARLRGIF